MKSVYENPRHDLFVPNGYGPFRYKLTEVKLENIVDNLWGIGPTKIKETPHYKYAIGEKQPLIDYFESCRGYTWARKGTSAENMPVGDLLSQFDDILVTDSKYLEPPYDSHYIIVESTWFCIDGLRRSCSLLANGIEESPVAWVY